MNIWLVMLAGGALTFLTRLSFIFLLSKTETSPILRRALTYVPPAVLSAIIFPELFLGDGGLNITLGNERLLAGIAAALVAWRTRNALAAILAGMVVLIILLNLI